MWKFACVRSVVNGVSRIHDERGSAGGVKSSYPKEGGPRSTTRLALHCFVKMFTTDSRRPLSQCVGQYWCPNQQRRVTHHRYLAKGLFLLLLCMSVWTSPSSAARSGLRQLGREARARIQALFRIRPGSHTPGNTPVRGTTSLTDLTEASTEVRPPSTVDDSTQDEDTAEGDMSGQEEVAKKARTVREKTRKVTKDPLSAYVPANQKMLLRYPTTDGEHDFEEIIGNDYLGPTHEGLAYSVTVGGSKQLLRIICLPLAKEAASNQKMLKSIQTRHRAAVKVLSRLPGESAEGLIRKRVALPLKWGTLLGLPDTFPAEGEVCGKEAILYPAMMLNLSNLLKEVDLSVAAKVYLTNSILETMAALHSVQLAHFALSTRSFWINHDGEVVLFLEDDYSSGDFGLGATADLVSSREHASLGGSHLDVDTGPAGGHGTMRSRGRPPSLVASFFAFAELRDSQDLALVLFEIWCGQVGKGAAAAGTVTSGTMRRRSRPISFRSCPEPPPNWVRKVIKGLQSPRRSHQLFPKNALSLSPLFAQEISSRPSSGVQD